MAPGTQTRTRKREGSFTGRDRGALVSLRVERLRVRGVERKVGTAGALVTLKTPIDGPGDVVKSARTRPTRLINPVVNPFSGYAPRVAWSAVACCSIPVPDLEPDPEPSLDLPPLAENLVLNDDLVIVRDRSYVPAHRQADLRQQVRVREEVRRATLEGLAPLVEALGAVHLLRGDGHPLDEAGAGRGMGWPGPPPPANRPVTGDGGERQESAPLGHGCDLLPRDAETEAELSEWDRRHRVRAIRSKEVGFWLRRCVLD